MISFFFYFLSFFSINMKSKQKKQQEKRYSIRAYLIIVVSIELMLKSCYFCFVL
jgi:uncharacterized membrane protein